MDDIWRKAVSAASDALEAYDRAIPDGLPDQSPFSFDELLGQALDQEALVDKLARRALT